MSGRKIIIAVTGAKGALLSAAASESLPEDE